MNPELMIRAGFGKEVKRVQENKCPFCATDMTNPAFRDDLSKREFEISGMCQECQDATFGLEEE